MVQVTFVLCSIPISPLWGVGYWNGIWEWDLTKVAIWSLSGHFPSAAVS